MDNHISKFLPKAESLIDLKGLGESETPLNQTAVAIVNKLFVFFYATCRGFDKQFQDPKKLTIEKTQWFRAFTDENMTDMERLNLGIKKCRLESPINIPTIGQFLKWCIPTTEDLGLLTKEKAFDRSPEFMREGKLKFVSEDQNKLMEHVIRETGSFFLKNNSLDKTQPVFYRNYEIALRDFIKNRKFNEINKGLEDKSSETQELQKQKIIAKDFTNLKGYEQNMPEIRKILGMNPDGTTNRQGMHRNN